MVGGDLYQVPGRGPVYLLRGYAPAEPDPGPVPHGGEPPVHPSHLLNARTAVVEFVGREAELRDLTAWRDSGTRRAALWLHAAGGQGKTRLADEIAARTRRLGWKVLSAEQTIGRIDDTAPASQDLRIGGARGLLVLVDYADRWPLTHLTWLFSNKVLRQDVPVRVLLLARTAQASLPFLHALDQAGWAPDTFTDHRLDQLPDSGEARGRMFAVARDCFARHYGLDAPEAIAVPTWLEQPEFGLTLAVHMAALVAVDRQARNASAPPPPNAPAPLARNASAPLPPNASAPPPPADLIGLTSYLLARERHHWQALYDGGTVPVGHDPAGGRTGLDSTPLELSRAVFVAALTGALPYRDARHALARAGLADADRVLDDHGYCYPPTAPDSALEPLYPDRLAEDFLALTLPGHRISGHVPDPWVSDVPELLLGRAESPDDTGHELPPFAPRTITFLVAAATRWPHLRGVLEAVEARIPDRTDGALSVAAATLAEHLAEGRLAGATDAERARILQALAARLAAADRYDAAVAALRDAVPVIRQLASDHPPSHDKELAEALVSLGACLLLPTLGGDAMTAALNRSVRGFRWAQADDLPEAEAVIDEGLGIFRRLAAEDPTEHESDYVHVLGGAAGVQMRSERFDRALPLISEVVTLWRGLERRSPGDHEDDLLTWLVMLAIVQLEVGRPKQALASTAEVIGLSRRSMHENPARYGRLLASGLDRRASALDMLHRPAESADAQSEAVRTLRSLHGDTQSGNREDLQFALQKLAQLLAAAGREQEAVAAAEEAVAISRDLLRKDPAEHEGRLTTALTTFARVFESFQRWEESLAPQIEGIGLRRRMAWRNPAEYQRLLSVELTLLAKVYGHLGRWEDMLSTGAESMAITFHMEGSARYGPECALTPAVALLADPAGSRPWTRRLRKSGSAGFTRSAGFTNSAGFTGELAEVVDNFVSTHAGPAREDPAFPGLCDIVELLRRRIAEDNPASRLYLRLTGSDPLGTDSSLPESPAESAAALERAGGLRRGRRWPAPRRAIPAEAERAAALGRAAVILRRLGRHEEALAPAYAAVNVLLRVGPNDTERYEFRLADAWMRAGIVSAELGMPITGAAAMRRAIACRRRSARDPVGPGHLAVDLAVLGRTLARSGELDDALACVRESMAIRRRLGGLGERGRGPKGAREIIATARTLLDAVATSPEWRGPDADHALGLIDQALLLPDGSW
ncbi:tetratricopeptide repeat protein [Kitasatospora sp. NPDC096140]|uniref:tetratricopeptide repeat protein n=1 Tax=Kitasatospora sp. NPDC096140 TaxID=3155425 RepID=UPI00331CC764